MKIPKTEFLDIENYGIYKNILSYFECILVGVACKMVLRIPSMGMSLPSPWPLKESWLG